MKNITLIFDTCKYPYHNNISNLINHCLSYKDYIINKVDLGNPNINQSKLNSILFDSDIDFLITLDLSGFNLRTQTGECAMNLLYSKNLNIIWGNSKDYVPYLSKKISMSMVFYDVSGNNNYMPTHYPNMLFYNYGPQYFLPQYENISVNSSNFNHIWSNFLHFCQN